MTTIERNASGAMTIRQAAKIVYGAEPTNAVLLDEASNVVSLAARIGYRFSTTGALTPPAYQVDHEADEDERRYQTS